jgi:hypothetical protein
VNLTDSQKQQIARDIGSQPGEKAPAGFIVSVGSKVPSSMTLHALPSKVSTDVSSAKSYEYVKLQDNNEILLVNPSDRQIVAVIQASGTTTGSGGAMSPKK